MFTFFAALKNNLEKKFVKIIVDEAPDTGDDSDEDLVTNYLSQNGGNGGNGANSDNLVPTIHITPQSPNGNHILGKKF